MQRTGLSVGAGAAEELRLGIGQIDQEAGDCLGEPVLAMRHDEIEQAARRVQQAAEVAGQNRRSPGRIGLHQNHR